MKLFTSFNHNNLLSIQREYMKEEVEECAEDEATESEEDVEFDERTGCLPKGS